MSVHLHIKLTARQTEVLRWVADGKRNEDIAKITGSTPRAVQAHVRRLMDAMGAGTRAGAVAVALRRGIIT